jgi:hypothetical protein
MITTELVNNVLINAKNVLSLPLIVTHVPIEEKTNQPVPVQTNTSMMVLPQNVNHVVTDVLPVLIMLTNVLFVPPVDYLPQIVSVQIKNLTTEATQSVKIVLINVTYVPEPPPIVTIVPKTESKNQIVIVHLLLDSITSKNRLNVQDVPYGVLLVHLILLV